MLLREFYSITISGDQYCQNCCKAEGYRAKDKENEVFRKLEQRMKTKNGKCKGNGVDGSHKLWTISHKSNNRDEQCTQIQSPPNPDIILC